MPPLSLPLSMHLPMGAGRRALALALVLMGALWALTGCALVAKINGAETPATQEASSAHDVPDPTASASASAFSLHIEAPAPLDALLAEHLELRRYRDLADLQPSELARLLRSAEANASELLATQGYFSPQITITSAPAAQTAPGQQAPREVRVQVLPGPQTLVDSVDMRFTGPGADAPEFAQRAQALQESWPLRRSQPFTQEGWEGAKALILRQLQEVHYPQARLQSSRADIDADGGTDVGADTTRSGAHLQAIYDTGAPYRLGLLHIQGGARYDEEGARRIAQLPTGALYRQSQLLDAQQRLASSGYYDSVFLTLDTQTGPPEAAPVIAQVREAPLHKLTFGAGLSTDSGARLSLQHIHNRLPLLGWRATSKIDLDRDTQQLESEWVALPNARHWRWFGSGQYKREVTGSYAVRSTRWRAGQGQTSAFIDRNFYLQLDTASPQGPLAPAQSAALSANFGWTARYFNHPTNPTKGYGLALELGAGSTLRGQRDPFARALLRWQSLIPLGAVALADGAGAQIARASRLQLRAEGGAVLSAQDADVPTSQLFITGGDTSVRGYGYRSIGAPTVGGGLYGGRYLAVASAEWQRPITVRGNATHWESAWFIDAGAVGNEPQSLRPQVGIGAGLRWRSPVGPLQTDLAWGVQSQRLRLHLRLGFSF